LKRSANRFVNRFMRESPHRQSAPSAPDAAPPIEPIGRLILTDEVSRVLFDEFAAHRQSERGAEETGWALLGVRQRDEAIALATLPAGTRRDAGKSHVGFDPIAQAAACRVVRQGNRRLTMLGIVHTHPGSMRHPSDGDYQGDIVWVENLRGQEGIFGIGTADAKPHLPNAIAWQPATNQQCLDDLCLSWYALRSGDRNYRPLSVEITLGPDLALALRPVWCELEVHAERLDRLAGLLQRVRFDVVEGKHKPALAITVPLAEADRAIRVLMEGKEVRYLLIEKGQAMIADFRDDRIDRGLFVMLAELST
jgi:Prokaryotic homologs of the JAB domain